MQTRFVDYIFKILTIIFMVLLIVPLFMLFWEWLTAIYILITILAFYFLSYLAYFKYAKIQKEKIICYCPFRKFTSSINDLQYYYLVRYNSRARGPQFERFEVHENEMIKKKVLPSLALVMTKNKIEDMKIENINHRNIYKKIKNNYICDIKLNRKILDSVFIKQNIKVVISKDDYSNYKDFVDNINEKYSLSLIIE